MSVGDLVGDAHLVVERDDGQPAPQRLVDDVAERLGEAGVGEHVGVSVPVDESTVRRFAGEVDPVGVAGRFGLLSQRRMLEAIADEGEGHVRVARGDVAVEDLDKVLETLFPVVPAHAEEPSTVAEVLGERVAGGLLVPRARVDRSTDGDDRHGDSALAPVVDHEAALHHEAVTLVVHGGELLLRGERRALHELPDVRVLVELVREQEVAVRRQVNDVRVEHGGAEHLPLPERVMDLVAVRLPVDQVDAGTAREALDRPGERDADLGVRGVRDAFEEMLFDIVTVDVLGSGLGSHHHDFVPPTGETVVEESGVDRRSGLDADGREFGEDTYAHRAACFRRSFPSTRVKASSAFAEKGERCPAKDPPQAVSLPAQKRTFSEDFGDRDLLFGVVVLQGWIKRTPLLGELRAQSPGTDGFTIV